MNRTLIILTIALLWSCSEDSTSSDPGPCEMKTVDGEAFCFWKQSDVSQGADFNCPDTLENLYEIDGNRICSSSGSAPSAEVVNALKNEEPQTKPMSCKATQIEVASQPDCSADVCYELSSGKWCTEENKPESCKGEEIRVSDNASCTENSSICYEIQSGEWCTENPNYQYVLIRDTTSGEGCQGTDAGSDLMWVQLLDKDGVGLAWASVVKHEVGSGVNTFNDASILSGSPPMINGVGCSPFTADAVYSMGCGGSILLKFGEKVLPKPIDIHKGEASITVGEYGVECGGNSGDDYELFACTDSEKAATGDLSSCRVSLGRSTGIDAFVVPK